MTFFYVVLLTFDNFAHYSKVMLKHLTISNFTLIESVELSFSSGLTIITGETGAGKSIIVDALMLILGERASSDLVRSGSAKAIVEGRFDIVANPDINELLLSKDYDVHPDEVIIRREITSKGQSRSFVNDSPAPYSLVKSLGELLVDFHGQHEHQSLFRVEEHLRLLDSIGGITELTKTYTTTYNDLIALIEKRSSYINNEQELRSLREYKKFQLQELTAINPKKNEFEELHQELLRIENHEKIYSHCHDIYQLFYEDHKNVGDSIARTISMLEDLVQYDTSFSGYITECKSALVSLEETALFAQRYSSHIDFDAERITTVRERISQLNRLKKKYGSVDAAYELMESLSSELQQSDDFTALIHNVEQEIDTLIKELSDIAETLKKKREKISKHVTKEIVALLESLSISSPVFEARLEQKPCEFSYDKPCLLLQNKYYEAHPNGADKCEFYISTNKGEQLKPLSKTASGGEISRVLLALKSILAKNDRLPMLVFDEIDTGISGRIAQKVGKVIKELAEYHQVIAITHLPQVAAFAETHIVVEKKTTKTRTVISAHVLDAENHIKEVAKLLSGENISEATIESARQLVQF